MAFQPCNWPPGPAQGHGCPTTRLPGGRAALALGRPGVTERTLGMAGTPQTLQEHDEKPFPLRRAELGGCEPHCHVSLCLSWCDAGGGQVPPGRDGPLRKASLGSCRLSFVSPPPAGYSRTEGKHCNLLLEKLLPFPQGEPTASQASTVGKQRVDHRPGAWGRGVKACPPLPSRPGPQPRHPSSTGPYPPRSSCQQ